MSFHKSTIPILVGVAACALLCFGISAWRSSNAPTPASGSGDDELLSNKWCAIPQLTGKEHPPALPRRWQDATSTQNLSRFGVKRTDEIDPEMSVFFFGGRYIDTPYVVSRKGLGIFVNDVQVDILEWPSRYYRQEKPAVPSKWTKSTPLGESAAWRIEMFRWCHSQFPPDEALHRVMAEYRRLPFIASVKHEPEGTWGMPIIKLTTHNGTTHEVNLMAPEKRDTRVLTDKQVIAELEQRVQKLRNHLLGHSYSFEYRANNVTVSFNSTADTWEKLPELIDILYLKNLSPNEKARRLGQQSSQGVFVRDEDTMINIYGPLLKNFRGSRQLRECMDRIRRERKRNPR